MSRAADERFVKVGNLIFNKACINLRLGSKLMRCKSQLGDSFGCFDKQSYF